MVVFVPRCIVGSLSVFATVDQDGREYFVEGLELNTRRTRAIVMLKDQILSSASEHLQK